MSYVPSEEDLNQYEEQQPSFGRKALDYEKGLFAQLGQSGAMAGYHLANAPSYAYEAFSGKPLYTTPKPQLDEFIPESEAGQTGKHVGETASDIASLIIPGRLLGRGASALMKYHPLSKGQMGRQFQRPVIAMEQAGVRAPMSYQQLQELSELLSHPALEQGGSTGRALTSQGRNALIQGGSQGNVPALHSAQSLLGDLERAIPSRGESYLASTRVRPLKEQILEAIQQGARTEGLSEEAENYQQARQGARRYFKTKENIRKVGKKVGKPLSVAAMIKAGLMGIKNLP